MQVNNMAIISKLQINAAGVVRAGGIYFPGAQSGAL